MAIRKNERGYLMIEAAIVYPMLMVIVVFFLYILMLTAQRAQMISAAEQTMVYVKYVCAGHYSVYDGGELNYSITDNLELPEPSLYNVYATLTDTPSSRAKELNSGDGVKNIFNRYIKSPLLGNVDKNYNVHMDVHNYVLFTEIDLTVEYKLNKFLNFSFIGGEAFNEPTFKIELQGVVTDNTSNIRMMQYIDYFTEVSGIDKSIGEVKNKIKGWFK